LGGLRAWQVSRAYDCIKPLPQLVEELLPSKGACEPD